MASYEVEHDVPVAKPTQARQRPDLDTFYAHLATVDTAHVRNEHATPMPADVGAAYRLLGEAMAALMQDNPDRGLASGLQDFLMARAEMPPDKVQGVPEGFVDGLDRVSKKSLKKSDDCPICGNPFLEDPYPLVVRLPCSPKHMFDLECIQPWLKLNATCPLDRKSLVAKPKPTSTVKDDAQDAEEEYDDMYG